MGNWIIRRNIGEYTGTTNSYPPWPAMSIRYGTDVTISQNQMCTNRKLLYILLQMLDKQPLVGRILVTLVQEMLQAVLVALVLICVVVEIMLRCG
jgi:hypothetical protein